jgi:glycosyltransferase involved in cell wall biosynthesis
MASSDYGSAAQAPGLIGDEPSLVIAMILRPEGMTGIHTHVRQLRAYLDRNGTGSTLVTPFSWARALTVPLFSLRFVIEPLSGSAGALWYRHWHEMFLRNALRKRLATAGKVVVYTQDPLAARAALSARVGPHQSVILVVHFPGSEADEWVRNKRISMGGSAYRVIRQQELGVIPQVDGIVYVSQSTREDLLSRVPEAVTVSSMVIPNFVKPLVTVPDVKPLGDLVTVGRLELVKNHRFLMEVLVAAKDAGSTLTLDIYGDGPCRKDLVRQAESLGLEGQVRFHGFRPDVRSFLPGYRCYVHSAIAEPFGLSILEAMAAGLPIVTGNVGGISELCDEGVEARFWVLDDPASAAATLLGLLGSEEQRARAGKASRKRFERDFDAEAVAPRLYSFLMSTPRRGDEDDNVTVGNPLKGPAGTSSTDT